MTKEYHKKCKKVKTRNQNQYYGDEVWLLDLQPIQQEKKYIPIYVNVSFHFRLHIIEIIVCYMISFVLLLLVFKLKETVYTLVWQQLTKTKWFIISKRNFI